VCALLAAKDHVELFLHDGAIIPDPDGFITGRHINKTARTIALKHGETINAQALTAMLKQIIANNRAGGWHKLKKPWNGPGADERDSQPPFGRLLRGASKHQPSGCIRRPWRRAASTAARAL
jgi:hypothetical protein